MDSSPEEGRRVFLHKIPQFILRWSVEEEERKMTTHPVIIMKSPDPQVNEPGVMASVEALIKAKPIKVSKTSGGDFEVKFRDYTDCERLETFHGKVFTGTQTLVKIKQVEPTLNVEEIFLLVNQKLAMKDRQDPLQIFMQISTNYQNRRTRSMSADAAPKSTRKNSPGKGK